MKLYTKKTAELRRMAKQIGLDNYETLERKDLAAGVDNYITKNPDFAIIEDENINEYTPDNLNEEKLNGTIKAEKEETIEAKKSLFVDNPSSTIENMSIKMSEPSVGGKAYRMKRILATQPKKPFFIPLEFGEKFGTTKSVILNGLRINILKNVYVDLPVQVIDVLKESLLLPTQILEGHKTRIEGSEQEFIR